MRVDVLTLHPEMVRAPLAHSILGRAEQAGLWSLGIHDIRDVTTDRHRTVDDSPYGGGAGMVMKVDVVARALERVRTADSHVILTAASGERFTQQRAHGMSQRSHIVILCGHYEGIDARIESLVDEVLCIGDFVMTGGEIAAAAMVDATVRLLSGVLGNAQSSVEESFADGLLEHPHYTRPRTWQGQEVPEVLFSGHHARINAWRLEQAKARTRRFRPDLWRRWKATSGTDVDGEGGEQ